MVIVRLVRGGRRRRRPSPFSNSQRRFEQVLRCEPRSECALCSFQFPFSEKIVGKATRSPPTGGLQVGAEPRCGSAASVDESLPAARTNAAFTCRHFGISRQCFYRWWRRYDPHSLATREAHSRRPHRLRRPTCSAEQAAPQRWNLLEVNRRLLTWERTYSTIRPHQALGYATPVEFLQRHHKSKRKIQECHQSCGRIGSDSACLRTGF